MLDIGPLRQALNLQARACAALGSPFCADLLDRVCEDLKGNEDLRRLFARWEGADARTLIRDAAPLRLLGAMHDLALSGEAAGLTAAFPAKGRKSDPTKAWATSAAEIPRHGKRLAAFMEHEPQTNEVRRSICLLGGFLTIADETSLELRCFELGASAGLNQLWDRYRYDLGGAQWGPSEAPLRLSTDWRGRLPPLTARMLVSERAACDHKPIDLANEVARRRLRAFVWADQFDRMERLNAAVGATLLAGVQAEGEDAVSWVAHRPQLTRGAATVLFHSVFWQYLSKKSQVALTAAIHALGAQATRSAQFAWLRMEPPPSDMSKMHVRLTIWPGGQERLLAKAHPHGTWVEWLG
ncbi:MAG TPA: DUF2332 family protein [Caulobacteraceae bacterium]